MGGAIFAEQGASVSISNCNIIANKSSNGGGIYSKGSLSIIDSHIKQNYAYNDGGGIYSMGSLELSGSSVSENKCKNNGGGIYYNNTQKLIIEDCDFKNNYCEYEGGAIACMNGSLALTDCEFCQNDTERYGAGIFTEKKLMFR